MKGIDSLAPGFERALETIPGTRAAWRILTEAAPAGLTPRIQALVGIVTAQRDGCDYARWVMARLGARRGLTSEEIFLATAGCASIARDAATVREAVRVLDGGTGSPAIVHAAAFALLACDVLGAIAPESDASAARARRAA